MESFAKGGWPAAVRASLEAPSGIGAKRTFVVADLFAQIGEKDRAFDVIDDMEKGRMLMMVYVPQDPMLDPIRDDPRYSDLVKRVEGK